jgi:hypothetical protein
MECFKLHQNRSSDAGEINKSPWGGGGNFPLAILKRKKPWPLKDYYAFRNVLINYTFLDSVGQLIACGFLNGTSAQTKLAIYSARSSNVFRGT